MNEHGKNYNQVLSELHKHRIEDVPWNRVLNSICSKPLGIAEEAYRIGMDTNLGDPRIFKGTYKLEKKVIQLLGRMLHGENCVGNIVTGGTEANFMAICNALQRHGTKTPEVILAETAHYSLTKILKILCIRPVIVSVDRNCKMRDEEVEGKISADTIAIVATAGTSEFGSIDPIPEIAEIAFRNEIYFHVDAATGGFIIPFSKNLGFKLPDFDFLLEGVSSITIDPHKYGLTPISSGALLFRDSSVIDGFVNESFFVGTPAHRTFTGTRSGAPIFAVYAILEHLGISGFEKLTQENYNKTFYLIGLLKQNDFSLFLEPELNIISFQVSDSQRILQDCDGKGWIISASKRVENVIRIVIQHHTKYEDIDEFIKILVGIEHRSHSCQNNKLIRGNTYEK